MASPEGLSADLTVIFCATSADDLLFEKALQWTDAFPKNVVFWVREKPIQIVPKISPHWACRIQVLKRLRFRYSSNPAVCAAAIAGSSDARDDVAAIFVTLDPKATSPYALATMLALMTQFCTEATAKAVIAVQEAELAEVAELQPNVPVADSASTSGKKVIEDSFDQPIVCRADTKKTMHCFSQRVCNTENDRQYAIIGVLNRMITQVEQDEYDEQVNAFCPRLEQSLDLELDQADLSEGNDEQDVEKQYSVDFRSAAGQTLANFGASPQVEQDLSPLFDTLYSLGDEEKPMRTSEVEPQCERKENTKNLADHVEHLKLVASMYTLRLFDYNDTSDKLIPICSKFPRF